MIESGLGAELLDRTLVDRDLTLPGPEARILAETAPQMGDEAGIDLAQREMITRPQMAEVREGLARTLLGLSQLAAALEDADEAIRYAEEALSRLEASDGGAEAEALQQALGSELARHRK